MVENGSDKNQFAKGKRVKYGIATKTSAKNVTKSNRNTAHANCTVLRDILGLEQCVLCPSREDDGRHAANKK